jgi:nucleoside-diphosphate-sugar epimerase
MNILVTGAGGFIGKRLIAHLAARGDRIVALHNRIPAIDASVNVEHQVSDLAQLTPQNIQSLFDGASFALVHLAWHAPREPRYAIAAQHLAQMAWLLELVKNRAAKVISLGSADEYGTREGCLTPETESEGVLSPYGWGKKCARELMLHWSGATGIPGFWLRPFTVYGEGQHGTMLIPYAVEQARAGQEASFSDGMQQRDFVHVDDVITAIDLALRSDYTGYRAANLGWGNPVQIKSVLQEIAHLFDAEHLFKFGVLTRRADEPLCRYADLQAAVQLGWQPRITLAEGLKTLAVSCDAADEPILKNGTL